MDRAAAVDSINVDRDLQRNYREIATVTGRLGRMHMVRFYPQFILAADGPLGDSHECAHTAYVPIVRMVGIGRVLATRF